MRKIKKKQSDKKSEKENKKGRLKFRAWDKSKQKMYTTNETSKGRSNNFLSLGVFFFER